MRIALFYHSLISDWNHGNAHFLRGVVTELLARGHDVRVYEPEEGWSLKNLVSECGNDSITHFEHAFPHLRTSFYCSETLDLDEALDGVEVVIVHEWNDHDIVERIGRHRLKNSYRLLFHDTHHRAVTDPSSIGQYSLSNFDGVLAFGEVIREIYIKRGWARHAWTWHEAADTRVFQPGDAEKRTDLVWIGNWGDNERATELRQYLVEPTKLLNLNAEVYGVRYPPKARSMLESSQITYRGWIANYRVPNVFAQSRMTAHIPRRPYARDLPGIPTIRIFEALACGIPLVSAPWDDAEGLFTPGEDFLMAQNPEEMTAHYRAIWSDPALATQLSQHGLETIRSKHTCKHRVDQLLNILELMAERPLSGAVAERETLPSA
jgi:spore maturation protein CgeB